MCWYHCFRFTAPVGNRSYSYLLFLFVFLYIVLLYCDKWRDNRRVKRAWTSLGRSSRSVSLFVFHPPFFLSCCPNNAFLLLSFLPIPVSTHDARRRIRAVLSCRTGKDYVGKWVAKNGWLYNAFPWLIGWLTDLCVFFLLVSVPERYEGLTAIGSGAYGSVAYVGFSRYFSWENVKTFDWTLQVGQR